MNLVKFCIMTLLGSFGWSAILMYLGYSAGPLWRSSSSAFFNGLSQAVPYLIIGASSCYVIYYVWSRTVSKKQTTMS
jgi:membrane protein DedA with SNARE-associated domain